MYEKEQLAVVFVRSALMKDNLVSINFLTTKGLVGEDLKLQRVKLPDNSSQPFDRKLNCFKMPVAVSCISFLGGPGDAGQRSS